MARSKSNSNGKNSKPKYVRKERDNSKFSAIKHDPKDYNDPNYYVTNVELADQAAQLSFQNMMGIGQYHNYEIPTILVAGMNPCPGVTFDLETVGETKQYQVNVDSAVMPDGADFKISKTGFNMMCSKMYTMLSTYSGRSTSYAPQDVGQMVLAISSFAEYSEFLRRAFGVALTYNARNRAIPLGLITSMGINPDDFIKNIAIYRMRFNVLMTRINQVPLLDNIGFIRKSRNMYQKIFCDSPSPMAQLFYWMPYSVWVIDETSYEQGTILKTHVLGNADEFPNRTMDEYLTLAETMVTQLLESSTLNLIYADLLNMANKMSVPVWQFDYLAENYVVLPEYSAEALLQLHNMRVAGIPGLTDYHPADSTTIPRTPANDVYPSVARNEIVYSPGLRPFISAGNEIEIVTDMLVDSPVANPDVNTRLEMLRYTAIDSGYWWKEGNKAYKMGSALPDHYVVSIIIFGNAAAFRSMQATAVIQDYIYPRGSIGYKVAATLSQFTLAPFVGERTAIGDTFGIYLAGDTNFWTVIDWAYLRRVNDVLYTGLFDFRV